jgi:hypothetical protein
MEQKPLTFLDGSKEEREKAVKEFFGLSPDRSFQDLDVDENVDERSEQ